MEYSRKKEEIFTLVKKITLYVGLLTMFVAGIYYMFVSDTAYGNQASALIVASILSLGSAGCYFASTNMKDFPVKQIVLRSIGLALGIGFILFLHLSTNSDFYQSITPSKVAARNATTVVSLVLGYLALVAQAANLVLICVIPED